MRRNCCVTTVKTDRSKSCILLRINKRRIGLTNWKKKRMDKKKKEKIRFYHRARITMIGIGWLLFDFLFFFETQYNIIFTRYHRNNEHESRVIRVHSCKRTKKKKKKMKNRVLHKPFILHCTSEGRWSRRVTLKVTCTPKSGLIFFLEYTFNGTHARTIPGCQPISSTNTLAVCQLLVSSGRNSSSNSIEQQ
uniref:Uncharacterized protein n=1 Tax=Sipha flava TaxID=143950 RepID=A0A2S2QV46_9HEMI